MKYPLKEVSFSEKIRRSEFIGYLTKIENFGEVKEVLAAIGKIRHDATHNTWAYILGYEGETCHFSDDGEPSGTAGKPILQELQKNDLSNSILVVTRYFGGIKLGVRGLIDAYRRTAAATILLAETGVLVEKKKLKIKTQYGFWDSLNYQFKTLNARVEKPEYETEIFFELVFSADNADNVNRCLQEKEKLGQMKILSELLPYA